VLISQRGFDGVLALDRLALFDLSSSKMTGSHCPLITKPRIEQLRDLGGLGIGSE
jgi:hypothetical protein